MTTITIPNYLNQNIVGILESRPEAAIEGQPPRLVLIAHGVMGTNISFPQAHTLHLPESILTCTLLTLAGHKNYLFQKLLAEKLPYENFRFDFRGNGESEGTTKFGNIDVRKLLRLSAVQPNMSLRLV